ncbi:MAG TPA: hypothetical protein ENJ19_04260 [Gammaproteobacteria bacterium]|nr:hypothetical protein [Gammaproteobacteria bacterium]
MNGRADGGFYWSLGATTVQAAYGASLFGVVGARYGLEDLGHFVWVFNAWLLCIVAVGFGNHQTAILMAADPDLPQDQVRRAGLAAGVRAGAVGAAALAALGGVWLVLGDSRGGLLLILSAGVVPAVMGRFLSGCLIGTQNVVRFAQWSVAKAVLTVIAVVLAAWPGLSLALLCGLMAGAEGLGLLALLRLYPGEKVSGVTPAVVCHYRSLGRKMGLSTVLAEAIARVDVLVVGMVLGTTATGLYGLLTSFARLPLLLSQSHLRLVVPALVAAWREDDLASALCVLERAVAHITRCLVAGILLLAVAVPWAGRALAENGVDAEVTFVFMALFGAFSVQAGLGSLGAMLTSWGRVGAQLVRQALFLCGLSVVVAVAAVTAGLPAVAVALLAAYSLYAVSAAFLIGRFFSAPQVWRLFARWGAPLAAAVTVSLLVPLGG